MSTRSYIAIQEGSKVSYIYCHSDGYLSYNGVFLNRFFRTSERVKALINLGSISAIGYNIELPRRFNYSENISLLHLYSTNIHHKSSFVLDYYRMRKGQDKEIYHCSALTFGSEESIGYVYLFDTKDSKWYLIRGKGLKKKRYALDEILKNEGSFNLYKMETGDYENFNTIKENDLEYKKEASSAYPECSLISKYNNFLKEKGIHNFEFDYVKDEKGKRIYGLLTRKNIQDKKRTVVYRSSCIGDLVNYVLNATNKSFFS